MKSPSIRAQVAFSAIALGCLLLVAQLGLQFFVLRNDIVQRVEKHEFRALKDFALYLDEKLADSKQMLASQAITVPAVEVGNTAALEQYLAGQRALLTVFDDLYVFDARGVLLVDWPRKAGRRQLDMSERDYVREVVTHHRPYISRPILGKATRQPIVVVAAPVFNSRHQLVGILGGVLNLYKPNLLGSISSRKNGETGYYYLVSSDRVRIAHPDPSLVLQHVPPNSSNIPFERAMNGFEGTMEGTNLRGLHGLFTFARLQTTGWVVASVVPSDEAFAPIRRIYGRMLLVTVVMLLVFFPVLWLVSRRWVRPFTQLAESMELTAQRMREGLPVKPIAPQGAREVRKITHVFNAFVEARSQAEQAISVARDAAQAANESKSQFLANMSHEIRTPMNGILGMTDLCLQTRMTQEQRSYLTMVNTSARSLLAVINDILDFSKIEARKLDLDPHDFDVHALVRDCTRSLSLRATEKNLEMICDVACNVPSGLIGDPLRLQQILTNLLANAIKFTARGEIVLAVRCLDNDGIHVWLEWSVQDTGIGIAPDKQAMIFDTFTQADAGTARRFGGSGLGLAISRSLVEMMGGQIWVDSVPGQGSTFRFTTRLQALRHGPLQHKELQPQLLGAQVLVVDDNASKRRWLARELGRVGLHGLACDGASQAIESVRSLQVRCVLIDVGMPEIDGYTLARQLRELRSPEQLGIVMMGRLSEQINEEQMREHQVQGWLLKPVDPHELVAVLNALVQPVHGGPYPCLPLAVTKAVQAASWRVLLAEDTPVNQTLATLLLTRMGHEVTVVNNGLEAVEAHAQGEYDLVLMDIQMPEMSGIEATVAIRAHERERGIERIPIIAVTAHALKGDRERYLASGMDGYVSKPLSAEALKAEMLRCMSAAQPLA